MLRHFHQLSEGGNLHAGFQDQLLHFNGKGSKIIPQIRIALIIPFHIVTSRG